MLHRDPDCDETALAAAAVDAEPLLLVKGDAAASLGFMTADHLLPGSRSTGPLALVVGAYLLLSAIGIWRDRSGELISSLRTSSHGLHTTGAIAFLAGGAILSFHRHWGSAAEVTLNLVAAWWVAEGAGMLADPERVKKVLSHPRAISAFRLGQVCAGIVGLYLLAVGLFGPSH